MTRTKKIQVSIKLIGLFAIILFSFGNLISVPHARAATVYTVKASGGNFTTIQACVNTAQAGDTCLVSAGSWAGATLAHSGTSGNPITLLADTSGSQPILTGTISVGTQSYITVQGFYFSNASVTGSVGATFIKIIGNTFNNSGLLGGIVGLHADHVLIDGNIFTNVFSQDIIDQWGQYWVIRNNEAQGMNETTQHPDFWQTYCAGGNIPGAYVLLENNFIHDWNGGDTHFMQYNNNGCTTESATNFIIRYNRVKYIQSYFIGFQKNSSSQTMFNVASYNNTIGELYHGADNAIANQTTELDATNTFVRNELDYKSLYYAHSGGAAVVFPTTTPLANSLVFWPGQNTPTRSPLSNCVTSGGCKVNVDPLLTDYTNNNFSLQAGSPAIDAGTAQTHVAGTDAGNGTSLKVNEAYAFSDGFGVAAADWIAVGSPTNTVQISSIDYSTNTITLATSVSRNPGDPVYLYKDSDGTQVLYGTAPDIGASEYNPGSGGATPIKGDINLDHIVNSIDYSILNSDWFTGNARSDLNSDGIVNAIDYSILNSNWFKTW